MAGQAALQRQASEPARRPPVAAVPPPVHAVSQTQLLQRRLGAQGMNAAVLARSAASPAAPATALRVSSPQDAAEREAVSTAAAVMRMATPAPVSVSSAPAVQREPAPTAPATAMTPPGVASQISNSMSGGTPLPASVRSFMEPRFGRNFAGVRVHTGEQAASLSQRVNANAFTVGSHVFFGRNQYQPDRPQGRELIAHELTHTVQQGAAGPGTVQRDAADNRSYSDRLSDAAGELAGAVLPDPGTLALKALGYVAPTLVPIVNRGPAGLLDWLKGKAMAAVEGVFNALMAPVNRITGAGQSLTGQLAPVITSLQTAAGQIAKNDCSPIRDAADKLEKAAEKLITPIVETLQPVVAAIKDFLNAVWDKLGAPIWNWIKEYAAFQWEQIKAIAQLVADAAKWLWDNTSAIREVYSKAWTWLKNKLGIGDGPEGEAGILQWVQGKLGAVWDGIKAQLAPFSRQLTIIGGAVAGVALALSPAGPILAVGGAVAGAIQGIRWIAANWGKGNIIATARVYLQQTLIPPLLDAVNRLGAAFSGVAASIAGALNGLAAGLAGAVGVIGGSILSFAVSAMQWIAAQATALAAWANGQLTTLKTWLTGALGRLQALLEDVLAFFGRIADVVLDIWGLPVLLGEAIWNKVPACVRDPIVDFLGPIILRQIEIFQELAKDNEAWQKTKADVGKIIKLVFHDHDLMGAVRATFHLILRVFNLPPDLLATVANKALAAWDIVIKKPLDFIKNTIRSVGFGFKMLWDNKIENLKLGLQGWLLGEIKDKNIVIPTDWSAPRQLFDFALSVLGINADHIFVLMKRRAFKPSTIDGLRSFFGKVAGVVAWVDKAIDTTKTPAENAKGMVDQAKDFGKTALTGLAEWVAGKVAEEVAIMLAAAAASAGLSEIVDIARRIYRAILTAVRWARRILDMANQALDNVLDIAGGAVEKVGRTFYKIMQGGLPVIVGFLADQVGLGGVGAAIRGIIDKLRDKVDNAILWVLDRIRSALDALVGAAKAGIAAVKNWWTMRKSFRGADGQPHEVYFQGGATNADLMVASRPQQLRTFLNHAETVAKEKETRDQAAAARAVYNRIQTVIRNKDDDAKSSVPGLVNELSEKLAKLVGIEDRDMPTETERKTRFEAPTGSSIIMLWKGNLVAGTTATGENDAYRLLSAAELTTSGQRWVRMHLISRQIGGPGTPNNWVMAPTGINTGGLVRGFETSVEALVKGRSSGKTNVIWVRVGSTGFHPAYAPKRGRGYGEGQFVSGVNFRAGLYFPDENRKWIENSTAVIQASVKVPAPSEELRSGVPNVNTASRAQLIAATGATPRFVDEVRKVVLNYGPFTSMVALAQSLQDHRDDNDTRFTTQFDDGVARFANAHTDGMIRFSTR